MQLVSPGVSVNIIDESVYGSAGPGTVPIFFVATSENKMSPDQTTIASGTLKNNSEKLYLVSSQRELVQLFGEPEFLSVGGSQLHGSPLNEYGILAAHSYLGIANRAYIVRADIDLKQLRPSVVEPTSCIAAGNYWLDAGESKFGLHVLVVDPFDASAVVWQHKAVDYVFNGTPSNTAGNNGEYAVAAMDDGAHRKLEYFVKVAGQWTKLSELSSGSVNVKVVAGSVYPVEDVAGNAFTTSDIGTAFWINTSRNSAGVSLKMKVSGTACNFNNLDLPVFAYDFTDPGYPAVIDQKASDYFGSGLSNGSMYVRAYFFTGESTVVPPASSPYVSPDLFIIGNSTPGPDPVGDLDGESYLEVFVYLNGAWVPFKDYLFQMETPRNGPTDGTYWFNADVGLDAFGKSTVDLLVNDGQGSWVNISVPGYTPAGRTNTAINFLMQSVNPLDMVTPPLLNNGDLWLDTSDLENYPAIYRWRTSKWVKIDNTNQTTPSGILFADARPHPEYVYDTVSSGLNNGSGDAPDLDMGVPDPDAYPAGMLLWNTRFSTNNVKVWNSSFPITTNSQGDLVFAGRWESASGNQENGALIAGVSAQRKVVQTKLQSVISSNDEIRAESIFFNLIATPGFGECIDEMLALNIDRKETAFVVGDAPFTLAPNSTDLQRWAMNLGNAPENGVQGLISADPYLGVYYPSAALTTNLDGNNVVVPASHVVMRTMAYNDQVAYQWFAPAGLQRGRVSNATSVGYVNAEGEYVPVSLNNGQRDVLYTSNINPIVQFPGQGVIVYGQKTRNPFASAMDRINVARLTNFMRYQLDIIVRPFLFEPNDKITRDNVKEVVDRFVSELVTLRGITDFLVVCDESNNSPARIDRNELWIDVYVVPTKSVEFIYIPVRIRNTGGI